LITIGRLELVMEKLLEAEGFKDTTVSLCAYRDAPLNWDVRVIGGSYNRVGAEKALHRLVPELQKRFRLMALRRRDWMSSS
jgi:hypothetical protein